MRAIPLYPAFEALRATTPAVAPMGREPTRLEAAMDAHLRLVWCVLRRAGLGESDADEATQDVFMVLHRRLEEVPVRAERSFLIGTALRVASDRRRAQAARPQAPLIHEPPGRGPGADELVALRRARVWLDEALATLSEEQRAVFVLTELEELTAREVAEILEIPLGTVASRLRTARQTFDAAVRRLHLRRREQPDD